jgi:hypothetical protein
MRGRRWVGRLALAAFATLLALKVGDMGVGWLRDTRQRHLLRLPARGEQRHRGREFDYTFQTNSLGLRGPERAFAKAAGTQRVVVVGDSFVAGFGVGDGEVFTARLERILNERSQPTGVERPIVHSRSEWTTLEVINVGRNGTSTIRELDLYRLIGRRFEPDVVVLAFYVGNDLVEVVQEHDAEELRRWHPSGVARRAAYGLCPNLYFELALLKMSAEARQTEERRSDEEILTALRRMCGELGGDFEAAKAAYGRLPGDVKDALAARLLRDHQVLAACCDPGRLRRALAPDEDFFARAWPRVERHLELLREEAGEDKARFVVLIIPDAVQVDPEAQRLAAEIGFEVEEAWLTSTSPTQAAVVDWCRKADVPCLDLTDKLRQSAEPLYYRQDGHWNEAGHERAAELLADFLREKMSVVSGQ